MTSDASNHRGSLSRRGVQYRRIGLSRKAVHCPRCGTLSSRRSEGRRRLREVGISAPTVLEVVYSKHYCPSCRQYFSMPMEHIAQPGARYTNRVRRTSVDMVVREGMTLETASERMQERYFVFVPPRTIGQWVKCEASES